MTWNWRATGDGYTCGLVDSSALGNFVDQSWAMDNIIDLQEVKKEVNIRTFNGTLARGGRVTQKTCGVSVKIGSKALATTFRVLKKSQ